MICKNESCLKPFEPKKDNQDYCNKQCGQVQRNREFRRRNKVILKPICRKCKEPFETTDGKKKECDACGREKREANLRRYEKKNPGVIKKRANRNTSQPTIYPAKEEVKRILSKEETREIENRKFANSLPMGKKKEQMIEEFFKKNPDKRLIA